MHESPRFADPFDRASAEQQLQLDDALAQHRLRSERDMPTPTPDGACACGCGEAVEPARLRLGLGLTFDCAARREAASAHVRRLGGVR